MSWLLYRWVWRLEAPLYVGMPPAGVLNRCRLYVPARTLWGALTAELARRKMEDSPGNLREYETVGKDLRESCRFSYLYPAEQVDGVWRAWLPVYEVGKGLCWKREDQKDQENQENLIPDRDFRRWLLDVRPSTAVDPTSDSAAEGSFHETELIQPWWRGSPDSLIRPVGMVGYFLCKDENLFNEIKQVCEIYLGGDTRYGLGKAVRVELQQDERLFGHNVVLDDHAPRVQAKTVLAHALIEGHSDSMKGTMEALVGWDVGKLQPIGELLYWVPGSNLEVEVMWELKDNGIWKYITSSEA